MTAPAWMCLGHRTRGELAPICRDCERQCDDPSHAIASPAITVIVDNVPAVICQHWHAAMPVGEAQESDFAEWSRCYGGTD